VIKVTDIAGGVALDPRNLNTLRQGAASNSPEAIKTVAKQMEGLFVDMVLKSMRKATSQDGPLDNDQTRLFSGMLDSQISQHIHVGLADVLIQQLSKTTIKPPSTSGVAIPPVAEGAAAQREAEPSLSKSERIQSFFSRLAPYAEQASQATGIPAQFMLSHAALESGWGRREIRSADGTASHNLFGIKATKKWSALSAIDGAISMVTKTQGFIGALQNRFTSAVTNLQSTSTNLSAARSRIQDTDFASETANMTRTQVLQQAGTAILAQANSAPNGVMSLLR